ncbi:TPA: hypothetical protein DCW38_06510 [candidate division WOR-3 bacterium]|uniref:Tetratricopeptide repeat protein n=1 Tax=candidate division WOR-3 bacterium TaxID=2052148 RepID=A0A350HB99_UNCW3|nr:hypothetical protein [candidate division WOR-3 bacterium]
MRLKNVFIIILLLPVIAFASFAKTTDLLDIPTAAIMNNGELSGALYFSMASNFADDKVPFDYNIAFSYGLFDMFDISLNMFTLTDYTLGVQYNFVKPTANLPAVSFGIRNITYRQYIDASGGGDSINSGFADYSYTMRASDWFSIYVVATKDFKKFGKYTIGLGRGEFVGYGRGQYLSTAAFFDDQALTDGATEYMFGLFGGVEIPIIKNLNFLGEVTGRDVNMGLEYAIAGFNIAGGLTHAELFTAGDPTLRPRIDLGANYTYSFGTAVKKESNGYLIINIVDNATNKLLPAVITFEESTIKPISIASGYVKMQIKPGKYKIKIEANNYKWQKREFSISSSATSEINIKLNKKDDTETVNHDKAIALAKEAKEKLNKGDIAGALLKLDEAQKLSPDDPTVLAYMQEANTKKSQMIKTYKENALMYEQKGWAKSAISEWNSLLLLDKNNTEAKDHIKNLEKDANKTEVKKDDTVKTETKKIDPEKVYEEGYMAYLAGDYKTAIKKFEEVLKASPNHEKAQKYLDKAKKRL